MDVADMISVSFRCALTIGLAGRARSPPLLRALAASRSATRMFVWLSPVPSAPLLAEVRSVGAFCGNRGRSRGQLKLIPFFPRL